jgi:hypothetical protein
MMVEVQVPLVLAVLVLVLVLVRGAVLVNSMITLRWCDVVIQENLMMEVSGCDGCNEDAGWYL